MMPQWQRLGNAFLLTAAAGGVVCAQSVSEGFDSVADLPGLGWVVVVNNSNPNPATSTSVFQGNFNGGFNKPPPVFSSHSGGTDSYAAMNYNSTSSHGTISTWLISPELQFANGDAFSFFSRTVSNPQFPDRLEVRISYSGVSVDVGSTEVSVGAFSTLLFTINEGLTPAGFPSVWTQFSGAITGLAGPTSGRIAFRYFVPDAGSGGANSDYIGIDTFEFEHSFTGVPEASTAGGVALLAGVLAWQGRGALRPRPVRK